MANYFWMYLISLPNTQIVFDSNSDAQKVLSNDFGDNFTLISFTKAEKEKL